MITDAAGARTTNFARPAVLLFTLLLSLLLSLMGGSAFAGSATAPSISILSKSDAMEHAMEKMSDVAMVTSTNSEKFEIAGSYRSHCSMGDTVPATAPARPCVGAALLDQCAPLGHGDGSD